MVRRRHNPSRAVESVGDSHEKIHRVWTPPGRSRRERRNARAQLVGSLLIIGCVLAVVAVAWL